MDSNVQGHIAAMNRYPVKSCGGESMEQIRIEPYGMFGDRSHAFIDETKLGFARYITARQVPQLLHYRAELAGEAPAADGGFPELRLTSPQGAVFAWDEALRQEIEVLAARGVTLLQHRPEEQGVLAADVAAVHLISDASLQALSHLAGQQLDSRRFRANLLVALAADEPFAEGEWIGRELTIGEAILRVDEPCGRCIMTTIDPDSLKRDDDVLETIMRQQGGCFGVYASVVHPGHVELGDLVRLR